MPRALLLALIASVVTPRHIGGTNIRSASWSARAIALRNTLCNRIDAILVSRKIAWHPPAAHDGKALGRRPVRRHALRPCAFVKTSLGVIPGVSLRRGRRPGGRPTAIVAGR